MPPQPPAEVPAVTPQLLRAWPLPDLDDDGTKHDRGTVLVVGGAVSTPGAVLLAGIAALRTGAGRLQIATVEATAVALGVAVPEAAVVGLPVGPDGSVSPAAADLIADRAQGAAAVVVGPGLLGADATRDLLAALLPNLTDSRLVLDAVALTALAGHEDLLGGRDGVVLTPNAGELAALLGEDEADGFDAVARAAKQYDAVVATQGWVVAPGASGWAPAGPATSWRAPSAGCWPAVPRPPRPRSGAATRTPRPVTGWPRRRAGSASWPASCSTSCPRSSPRCRPELGTNARPMPPDALR